MSENLDPARTALLAAAATMAGPGASEQAISDNVIRLALMSHDDSRVMERLAKVLDAKRFVSTLTHIQIERSTRAVVTFRGKPTDEYPEGQVETVSTERTDGPEGAAMAAFARALIGHRVLVYKHIEDWVDAKETDPKKRNKKLRVLMWLTDLGLPDGAVAAGVDAPAPSRVAHEKPYDPAPHVKTPSAPRVKPTPMREEDRLAQAAADAAMASPEPTEPVGEDWNRDESAATAAPSEPPTTEQRNKILDLAGNIGRADAKVFAQAALGREVTALIVKDIHTAHDALKVIAALQGAWNDIQVERKQKAAS